VIGRPLGYESARTRLTQSRSYRDVPADQRAVAAPGLTAFARYQYMT
jgi:hypothetical protein